jgi:hypothetical protein
MTAFQKIRILVIPCLILLMGCARPQAEVTMQEPVQPTAEPSLEVQVEPTLEVLTESNYSLDRDPTYTSGAGMFDEEEAFNQLKILASDDMQGRFIGSAGNQQAGDYIADYFQAQGLEPAGTNSSYFQTFTASVNVHVDQPVLSITKPKDHTYVTHYEYTPRVGKYLGSGDVTESVVWLGNCDPSDFNSTLRKQIVLCTAIFGGDLTQAVQKALQYNVGGLLMILEDDGPYVRSGYGFGELIDIPAFSINKTIAEDILAGSQYTLDDLNRLDVHTKLDTVVHMACSFETIEVEGRNVLGLLPGSDPVLKDEIIIVGAHYDHVGIDQDGTIYNGADDNASGIAVIMEIIRLWRAQNIQPLRSVLFVAWDGEEVGLKGSGYYVSTPLYPLVNTVALLNLDCLGVGDNLFIYGEENEVTDQLQASAGLFKTSVILDPESLGDAASFFQVGILNASLMVNPDDAPYFSQMHRPEDDSEIIQHSWLQTAGVISAHTLFVLAFNAQ